MKLWESATSSHEGETISKTRDRSWESDGAVYTQPWVVEFILDLCGYDSRENLVDATVVEPCCGTGEFLEPIVRRLSNSCRAQGRSISECIGSLRAFELNPDSVSVSRERTKSVLLSCGWGEAESQELADHWVSQADFLLEPVEAIKGTFGGVDFVVGNPPYIRLEEIRPDVADIYRRLFKSMVGRADIYVGFYEKALSLLNKDGVCGFICSDRWMLNQYGNRLRKLITESYGVEAVIEMHRADAFQQEVLAYPAITIIRRTKQGRALVAKVDESSLPSVAAELVEQARQIQQTPNGNSLPVVGTSSVMVDEWFQNSDPWPCVSPERLKLLKRLESRFPPIEDPVTLTKVGIGVATGADRIFLTTDAELVETERLLPIALGKDTFTGGLKWSGHYLVNPWHSDGGLVHLHRYPLLKTYFESHKTSLNERNVAKRNPLLWYRTIDKVNHSLTNTPKLLIPDIKNVAHPVLDKGTVYPHHNLYYITSGVWNLKVLGGILLSRLGQFFIECYAVRMQGGYLRFQAQYLRRIRVPDPNTINSQQARLLSEAFDNRDVAAATNVVLDLYDIPSIPD